VTARRKTTDFGFREVPWDEKAAHVRDVFDSVADRYDVMNDLMSLGVHRLWKRFTIARARIGRGAAALDVAGGTGDLALGLARKVGREGNVVLSDINHRMLLRGRDRMLDEGMAGNVSCCVADAQHLPFPNGSFDCVTIGFGLRNVTDKEAALSAFYRVLKPGGQLLVLEFSHPVVPGLSPLYDAYSFRVLPLIGKAVAGDADSYRYLAESIRMHPDQDTLARMMDDAGFGRTGYHNLTGGIVALHYGYRL
jgi:demethylmenaquinone methyltransferase/2-methoxy-6-polyprenyl-1,4-benzoquinol methylase